MDKLNKIVQENLSMKTELDKTILINQKNEQKMAFYEEQLMLFKNNNDNYQKIIKELREQNKQLNLNLAKYKNASEENKKKSEEKYKSDIEEIKKNLENKIQTDDKNYESKINTLSEEIKTLKEKNSELEKELKNKDNIIQLMYKDNEKLTNQNNLNAIQI
jgi:chromosome segregation ATPase